MMTTATEEIRPELILDGLVRVFSECRDCHGLMQVTDLRSATHPLCQPKPTRMENWEDQWRSIAQLGDAATPLQRAKMTTLEQRLSEEVVEPTALANAAMQYAQDGWRVFPLAARSKKPAIPKDRGGRGFLDATSDVDRICKWWSRHSDHNIGLATGHLFDVIDIDPGAGGADSLATMIRDPRVVEGIGSIHGLVATAGADKPFRPSGMHLYVRATGKGSFAKIRQGVDYRGTGGYVVAPPSTLGNRVRSWSWSVAPSPMIKGER